MLSHRSSYEVQSRCLSRLIHILAFGQGQRSYFGRARQKRHTGKHEALWESGLFIIMIGCIHHPSSLSPQPTIQNSSTSPNVLSLGLGLVLLTEIQTDTVDTVPLVRRRRIAFPLENMSQVPATVRAHDLRPLHPERAVRVSRHRARDGVVERGPAAAGLEFLLRGVEGRVAARARVDAAAGGVFVVFAAEGGFGAFFAEDAELLWVGVSGPTREDMDGKGKQEKGEDARTWVQLGLPFAAALAVRVGHCVSGR